MIEVLCCNWCDHTQAHHGTFGCEVALCPCMLTRGDLIVSSLALAVGAVSQPPAQVIRGV